MSLVNFKITKEDISEADRLILVKIADIIENGIEELENDDHELDYQALLNFVMGVNQEYRKYIIVKVSDKILSPHIDQIKDYMRNKQAKIKLKVA